MNHLKIKVYCFFIFALLSTNMLAQRYSAYTSYDWDQWQDNQWGYIYSSGWCYAVAGERYSYTDYGFLSETRKSSIRPAANAKDFYFRFKYSELGLHELSKKEWKAIKKDEGWLECTCTFEYYITDQYPSIASALKQHSWPCAKYYVKSNKPSKLVSTKARAKVYFTDDDEVRAINFWIDGLGFAITVHWDYSGYEMTYTY